MRTALAISLALITIGYLVIRFGALVLDDVAADRETGEDAAYDAETVRWVASLREPVPEIVTVTPADASSLDDLLIDLIVGDLQLRGHVPAQRQPGESS